MAGAPDWLNLGHVLLAKELSEIGISAHFRPSGSWGPPMRPKGWGIPPSRRQIQTLANAHPTL